MPLSMRHTSHRTSASVGGVTVGITVSSGPAFRPPRTRYRSAGQPAPLPLMVIPANGQVRSVTAELGADLHPTRVRGGSLATDCPADCFQRATPPLASHHAPTGQAPPSLGVTGAFGVPLAELAI